MANRRMVSKDICCSDAFIMLSLGAQALYTQIVLDADDRGFCSSPIRIARSIGASDKDLQELIDKRFLIAFESGIVCVKHWLMQNKVQPTRMQETKYLEEFNSLEVKENGSYTEKKHASLPTDRQDADNMSTTCQQDADKLSDEVRLGKVSNKELLRNSCRFSAEISDIISYLNSKTGKKFRENTGETAKHINARLSEGYSVADFKAVIDTKVAQWGKDPQMAKYLRPQTLFAPSKFESYLNEQTTRPSSAYNEEWGF